MPDDDGDASGGTATASPGKPPASGIATRDLLSAPTDLDRQVYELDGRVPLIIAATLVGLVAATNILRATPNATRLLALGLLFGLALDPVVVRIQRRTGLRRGPAVAVLCGIAIVIVALLVLVFGPRTVDQARSFQQDLPNVVNQLTSLPLIGPTLEREEVPQKIQQYVSKLPKQLSGDTHLISTAAEAVTTGVVQAIAMGLLMVALLIDGPLLVARAQMAVPNHRRARFDRFGTIVYQVVGRYFAGSLLLAVLQGLQVLITGLILGVPLSPLLAFWAAAWNLVPQIGGAVGGISFVLVAFTVSPTAGVVAAIVFLVYLMFANNVLLPVIIGRSVDISPFTTMVAAITGFAIGGIVGAMLAAPVVGAAKAMYFELIPSARPPEPEPPAEPDHPGRLKRLLARIQVSPD